MRINRLCTLLTYKVKHHKDYSAELKKARQIAEFALKTRSNTSKDVKHFGLKSVIANQILRKYGRNKNVKRVRSVKLTIPGQAVNVNKQDRAIVAPCLKLAVPYQFPDFKKVNQIEVGDEYAYITVTVPDKTLVDNGKYIGVDLNTTGHVAVVSNADTGKIWKLGKAANHIALKYREIRRQLQKHGKYRKIKRVKNRQQRLIRNMNHHISKKIVQIAKTANKGIQLEMLTNIRQRAKTKRAFRYSLNSWPFYQLQKLIEYKAKLQGIAVSYIDPHYTSKTCSRCGHIGDRNGKYFKCPSCGHVDHADANGSFNIGKPVSYCIIGSGRLRTDRDVCKGSTDTPSAAPLGMIATVEPQMI